MKGTAAGGTTGSGVGTAVAASGTPARPRYCVVLVPVVATASPLARYAPAATPHAYTCVPLAAYTTLRSADTATSVSGLTAPDSSAGRHAPPGARVARHRPDAPTK